MKIEIIQMATGVSVTGELYIETPLIRRVDEGFTYSMDRRSQTIANTFRATPSVELKINLKEVYECGASWYDGVYIRRIDDYKCAGEV